jgi:hypothetical protein
MKCPSCQAENKDGAKSCRKCGANLQLPPLWRPDWAWHKKTLLTIYAILIVAFFVVRAALKPYVRKLPDDITPWLHPKGGAASSAAR